MWLHEFQIKIRQWTLRDAGRSPEGVIPTMHGICLHGLSKIGRVNGVKLSLCLINHITTKACGLVEV
jgi:hypothetical protein